jgi:hypothetical protein
MAEKSTSKARALCRNRTRHLTFASSVVERRRLYKRRPPVSTFALKQTAVIIPAVIPESPASNSVRHIDAESERRRSCLVIRKSRRTPEVPIPLRSLHHHNYNKTAGYGQNGRCFLVVVNSGAVEGSIGVDCHSVWSESGRRRGPSLESNFPV